MKIIQSFISNSSSSSFVVVLSDDFSLREHLTEDVIQDSVGDYDEEYADKSIKLFERTFNDPENDEPLEICEYNQEILFCGFRELLQNKLKKNVLSESDTSSESGIIIIFKKKQINAFLGGLE